MSGQHHRLRSTRSPDLGAASAPHTSSRHAFAQIERSDGVPLDHGIRGQFESKLNHSLEHIRIHADADAALAASSVDARAFTSGSDIAFADGAYRPDSMSGLELLAHELTHAVQYDRANEFPMFKKVSSADDVAEHEAESSAASIASGNGFVATAAPTAIISRSPAGDERKSSDPFGTGGGFFSFLGGGSSLGESITEGLIDHNWGKTMDPAKFLGQHELRDKFGWYGDAFGTMSGGFNVLSGMSRLMDGGGPGAALDVGKGALDMASGIGGLTNNPVLEGGAGMVSAGIDVGRGLYTAIDSDDLDTATGGAYQVAGGIADGITSFGDMTKNPIAIGTGRALGLGLKAGQGIVSKSDQMSKERGYFHDDEGNAQSGSSEAADWGRSVDEFFGDAPVLDQIGGVLGGATAAVGGIANSAYSYGHRAIDAIGDFFSGPSREELMKLRKEHPEMAWMFD